MAINTLFQNIANAIRSVNSSSDTYTPEEMPEAIMNLSTGDMLKSEYDPNETVLNAGGIVAYTADAISGKADSATTLAGYGIADAYTITQVDTLLSGKADSATTLAGYGIADAYTITQTDTLLSGKANSATTLAGYGITNAYTKTEADTLLTAKANASDLSSLSDTVDTNTNNISALNSSLTNLLTETNITSSVTFPNATLVHGGVLRNGNICMIKCNIQITTEIGNGGVLIAGIPKPLMLSMANSFVKMCPVRSSLWDLSVSKWHFQSFSYNTYIPNGTQTLEVGDIIDLDWTYIIDN